MIKLVNTIVLLSFFFFGVTAFSCYQCTNEHDGNGCQGMNINYPKLFIDGGSSPISPNGQTDYINSDCPDDSVGCIFVVSDRRTAKGCASQGIFQNVTGSPLPTDQIQDFCVQQKYPQSVFACLCLEDLCNSEPVCNVDMHKNFDICLPDNPITRFKRASMANGYMKVLKYGSVF